MGMRNIYRLLPLPVMAATVILATACPARVHAAALDEMTLITEASGYEENGNYAFRFDALSLDEESTSSTNGGTDVEVHEDGSATFSFKGQYAQAFYKLPEGMNAKRVSMICFADADPDNFSVKVLPAPGDDSLTTGVTYGSNTLHISGLDFSYFAAMTTAEGGTYSASKVIITLVDEPVVEGESRIVTKTLGDLALQEDSGAVVDEEGVTFSAQYQSVFFALPEDIDPAAIAKIEVKGDADCYHYKVMSEAQYEDPAAKYAEGILVSYGNPVLEFSDAGAAYLVIMSGDAEPYGTFSLASEVEFTLVPSTDVQMDLPDLKDTVASDEEGIGADGFMGTCIGGGSLGDEKLATLIKKHFNAVTLENELKPDSLLNGMNAELVEDPAFGLVPRSLNFSRPEQMLDQILEWNEEEGVGIKVRGHVLTWHSQTPTWFFREGYRSDGEYVTPDVMSKRHEWYIKSVLEHFFAENSPYKDLFYGFDVVNEACSDSSGTYRSAQENSEWAQIYGTGSDEDAPEYILNAFRFANKYAPETLGLYYNDYNECQPAKVPAICKLLTSVKEHEKDESDPTRISGFGMQAHHGMDSPSKAQILECAAIYGAIVGRVQVTELDIKASQEYDGSAASKASEYTRMAYRYKDIFEAYREIDQMPDIDVDSFTVWGAIDSVSWLNDANNAGGGADGVQKQCPLLFDGNYQAKPAFWGIVDSDMLDPYIKNVMVMQKEEGDNPYQYGQTYHFDQIDASFIPVWDADGISFRLEAGEDVQVGQVDLYVNWEGDDSFMPERIPGAKSDDGYYILEAGKENPVGRDFSFDIVVTLADEEGTKVAFNNGKLTHETDSRFFAHGSIKPFMEIAKGTVTPDGEMDDAWSLAQDVAFYVVGGAPEAEGTAKLLWDEGSLYVLVDVADGNLDASSDQAHEQDSVEVFIDENNEKSGGYQDDDKQYRISYKGEASFNGTKCKEENVNYAVRETEKGYLVEAAFAWTDSTPEAGQVIGLDLQVNDGKDGTRIGTLNWFDATGSGWSSPGVFGEAVLAAE